MLAKATISRHYRARLGLIALVGLMIGSWALYDGLYGYPRQREIYEAYTRLKMEGRVDDWPTYARAQRWPDDPDPKPRTGGDIAWQYAMVAFFLPLGLWFGWAFVTSRQRWIGVDEVSLQVSDGRTIPLSALTGLNDARWPDKGIAVVKYGQGSAEYRIVLDDWKFDRQATMKIHERVKAAVDWEKLQAG